MILTRKKYKFDFGRLLFVILITVASVQKSYANILFVENTNDSGTGSLRDAFSSAVPNDTILINVSGTIFLETGITVNGLTDVSIIGPLPKHNSISPSPTMTGTLITLTNCARLEFFGLGFVGGDENARHFIINSCVSNINFSACLFENGKAISGNGGSMTITSSAVRLKNCSFINNTAITGGAIYTTGSTVLNIVNATISNNSASGSAAAISINGTTQCYLNYSTVVNNDATNTPEAIYGSIYTDLFIESDAIGYNGTENQIYLSGGMSSSGGNRIRLNSFLDDILGILALIAGDIKSTGLDFELRASILEDGFGLKYWPIVDESSDLINTKTPGGSAPTLDCRNAPRNLKGSGAVAYADAGAVEYTHLRVTSSSGNKAIANSFLWTLEAAQSKDDVHFIEFDILSPTTISFLTSGITPSKSYIIDGFSQPGSAIPGPKTEGIDGLTPANLLINFTNGASLDQGLQFTTGSDKIQGVSVQGFNSVAIELNGDNSKIFGCEIGFDSDEDANGSDEAGVLITSDQNTIGGWKYWQRNVIAGNGQAAIPENANILIRTGTNNVIFGNIIGIGPDGITTLGTPTLTRYGVFSESSDNIIGGSLYNEGNVIGDHQFGIAMNQTVGSGSIIGNLIGLAWDETTAIGNDSAGIWLSGADAVKIGGYNKESMNIITNNGTGIALSYNGTPALSNTIIGNSIYNNVNQGIDLGFDNEVSPNDGIIDANFDNYALDFPEIIEASNCDFTQTKITYELSVPTGYDYRVEFFSNSTPDDLNGEGETLIGFETVSVTSNPQTFEFDLGILLPFAQSITATVTSNNSFSTSEFGTNILVNGGQIADVTYSNICLGDTVFPSIVGDLGGTFSFSGAAPDASIELDPITGRLTHGLEGSTYTIVYSFSDGCNTDDTTTMTVNSVDESFTVAPFCPEDIGLAIPTVLGGTFSLIPDPLAPTFIDPSTGEFENALEGETYLVQYIVNESGCTDTGQVSVTILSTDPTFTMEDFCQIEESPAAEPLNPGGVFTFEDVFLYGEIINGATGAITGGIEGTTYSITYTLNSPCTKSYTLDVTVLTADEGFTFPDFCPESDGIATPNELGGSFYFESDFDIAEIDSDDGTIILGVEGATYNVIHQIGACFYDRDTIAVNVKTVHEEFTFDDFCWTTGSDGGIAAELGGTWSFGSPYPIDGAIIDPVTGAISPTTEGTEYTVKHSLTTDGCTQADSLIVEAFGVDETFTIANICPDMDGSPAVPETPGGTYNFDPIPMDGATINPSNGIIYNGTEGSTYSVIYTIEFGAETCIETGSETVSVVLIDESFSASDFCAEFPSDEIIPTVLGGEFQFTPTPIDDAYINPVTGVITSASVGTTYGISYILTVEGCSESDTVYVYAKGTESAEFEIADHCANIESEAIIIGTSGGVFDFETIPDDGAEIDPTTANIINGTGNLYNVRYITLGDATTCGDTVVKVVELYPTPIIVNIETTLKTYCPENILGPISVTDYSYIDKLYWYSDSEGEIKLDSTFNFTPDSLEIGPNAFYYQPISSKGCVGPIESFVLTLSDTAGMNAGSDLVICLGSSAQLDAYGGIAYNWITDVPLSNYSIASPTAFSLKEEVYQVKITNFDNCTVLDTVNVSFAPQNECEIKIYNAFSPNEDGKNDFWYIDNLINYTPNTVYIYNRWGDMVNKFENYDNIIVYWNGKDLNGKDLIPGTYFYVVITEMEKDNQAGWVQIVR